jgi:hypothetical protein
MRWIALWTLTGLVVLAMPVTAEAGGSLRWKQVATATAPLVGDGTTVAWEESPGRVLVNRAGAPARIVRAPADCAGHAVAVGAGRLLLACSDSPNGAHITGYTVVDIATGTTRHVVVPAQAAGAGGEFPVFDQIGRNWLAGPYEGLHVSDTFLLDRRGPRPPPPRPAHLQRGPAPAPRLLGRAHRDHPLTHPCRSDPTTTQAGIAS